MLLWVPTIVLLFLPFSCTRYLARFSIHLSNECNTLRINRNIVQNATINLSFGHWPLKRKLAFNYVITMSLTKNYRKCHPQCMPYLASKATQKRREWSQGCCVLSCSLSCGIILQFYCRDFVLLRDFVDQPVPEMYEPGGTGGTCPPPKILQLWQHVPFCFRKFPFGSIKRALELEVTWHACPKFKMLPIALASPLSPWG